MVSKAVLLVFVQGILFQYISCQYLGASCNAARGLERDAVARGLERDALARGLARDAAAYSPAAAWNAAAGAPFAGSWAAAPMAAEWGAGFSPAALSASNGGGLAITSASPISPTGVAMTSENAYGGPLGVSGALPYLGTVALEGALPTGGAGAVAYGCGNGNVAMLTEDIAAANNGAYGVGPATAAELSYGFAAPLGIEAGIAAPAYGYRGCGCGSMY